MSEYLNLAGGAACSAGCFAGGIVVLALLARAWVAIGDAIYSNQMEQYRQFIIRTGRSITFYEWQQEQMQQTDEERAYIGREAS